MLNSVSWEQYLILIASLLFIYYVGILFVYYRRDLMNKLSSGRSIRTKKTTEPNYYNPFQADPGSLMGSIQQENPESCIQIKSKVNGEAKADGVGAIATSNVMMEEVPPLSSSESLLLGSVADLLKEVKTLIQLLIDNEGTKEDFIKLISALLARNPQLKNTAYRDAISLFIYNETNATLDFDFQIDEARALWK